MRKALLGLLAAAGSCSDFTLVAPELGPAAEPSMNVLLWADRSESSRYELRAVLFGGTDVRGQSTEPVDRVLYVEGSAVQPSPQLGPGVWPYEWEETRPHGAVGVDSLRIRAPVPAGSPVPGVAVTIPIAGRVDPAEVTWAEGEDLRLHVSPAVEETTQLTGRAFDWRLELGEACGEAGTGGPLFASGRGTYPPELRVPWEWLKGAAQAPTVACLHTYVAYSVPNAPYRIDVLVDLRLVWRIRMAGTS